VPPPVVPHVSGLEVVPELETMKILIGPWLMHWKVHTKVLPVAQVTTNEMEFCEPVGCTELQLAGLTALNTPEPPLGMGVGEPTHGVGPPVAQSEMFSPEMTPSMVTVAPPGMGATDRLAASTGVVGPRMATTEVNTKRIARIAIGTRPKGRSTALLPPDRNAHPQSGVEG